MEGKGFYSIGGMVILCALTPLIVANPVSVREQRVWFNSSSPRSVEVVVVVDKPAYTQWSALQNGNTTELKHQQTVSAITDFVKATFVSANYICQGMQEYGVFLDLRIDGDIRIIRDEFVATPNADGKTVDDRNATSDFFLWLIRNGFEFDHALLLTGLNLIAGHHSLHEGYAYMNTMCTPASVSVVENIMNGIPAVVFAHEVGHSFSATHDGEGNHCNSTSGYIMNANDIGFSPTHWNYSTCSAASIVRKLEDLSSSYDCLSEDSTRSDVVEGALMGQLYTADEICQMSEGNHSYVCRHLYRPDSKGICDILWCLVDPTYCRGVAPVDGLPCGTGKRCLKGECTPFDDVPEHVTDTCYTGDKPHPAWQNQSCSEVISSYTHLCLDQWYQDFCCGSCQNFYTGNDACPYGDAHDQCADFYCGTRWESDCCETCSR